MLFTGFPEMVEWSLATIVAAFLGSFLPSYMKKKGENLATHEDIELLSDQVAAVTRTAKEIEAKISSEVCDKQKLWELKRDVLLRATERLAGLDDALLGIASNLRVGGDWNESKPGNLMGWSKASKAFDETRLFVNVVSTKGTRKAFDNQTYLCEVP